MSDREPGHERSDASALGIAIVAVGVVAGFILMQLTLAGSFFSLRSHEREKPTAIVEKSVVARRGKPPKPWLQTNSHADLERYLAKERRLLRTFGWVDRKAGVARIPIERAMEMSANAK